MLLSLLSLIQLILLQMRKKWSPTGGIIKIDFDSLCKDLGNCSFVRRPGDTVSVLCEQYLGDLSRLLDKHAPLVTRTSTKQPTGWLSDSYRLAKNIR